jgi:hypothetical protein
MNQSLDINRKQQWDNEKAHGKFMQQAKQQRRIMYYQHMNGMVDPQTRIEIPPPPSLCRTIEVYNKHTGEMDKIHNYIPNTKYTRITNRKRKA